MIISALARSSLGALTVEITEDLVLRTSARAQRARNQLRENRIRVCHR